MPGYAVVWDKIYSEIRCDLGILIKCEEAENIINNVECSQSFELMKRSAISLN